MTLVRYAVERGCAVITLDSPCNRNALSVQLMQELSTHLTTAAEADDIRCVVLTHTGSTFCAGGDLAEGVPVRSTERFRDLLRQVVELPKPVLGRIDGHVRAAGIGLVGACDIAVAGPRTTFAFTEVRIGVAPAIIALTTLSRMSERAAARYCLTGETFDATTAAATGLVTVATQDVDAELERMLEAIRVCSPQGLAETKPLTTRGVLDAFDARAVTLQQQSARLFASAEAQEGMAAFLERRQPRWALPA
ncbi:Enoyl-CoA hydratase/isomerase [Parafrankia sp. EAN1pec]|uniref:enoyl-CoA hydratase family protein n=1 Tax=Parafrankia sp. (strain EAN1pec) TaxID=298653 RepID=UPI00005426A2|nr:Enoyl-CoA hydratase/isomerase [Frankia sp. EAN1pec]